MKNKNRMAKMESSLKPSMTNKHHYIKLIIVFSVVVFIAAGLSVGLFYYWDDVDKNKNAQWDIPPKKAEFAPQPEIPMTTVVKDAMRGVVGEVNVNQGLGAVDLVKGNPDAALAKYEAAILKEPNNAALYLQRGSVLILKGDIEGGVRDYEIAAKLNPAYETFYKQLKIIHEQLTIIGNPKLNQSEINEFGRSVRAEDVIRHAEHMGVKVDDTLRKAIEDRVRAGQR